MQLTHADNGSLLVEHDAVSLHVLRARLDDLSQPRIKGVGKANVANESALEKGERADALGAVDNLVWDDKVHGLDLLLQGTHGREGNDASHADVAQSGDVGSVGDFVGSELMVQAVTREEGNVDIVVREDMDRRRRRAPGRDWVQDGDRRVSFELSKARAANDGDVDVL